MFTKTGPDGRCVGSQSLLGRAADKCTASQSAVHNPSRRYSASHERVIGLRAMVESVDTDNWQDRHCKTVWCSPPYNNQNRK